MYISTIAAHYLNDRLSTTSTAYYTIDNMVGLTYKNNVEIDNEKCSRLAQELRSLLTSTVLTPDSEGYKESIVRWSDAMEKEAVSFADTVPVQMS
jgi:hypothetical protein